MTPIPMIMEPHGLFLLQATRVCHVINAIHGTGDCGQTALLKLAFFCLFCEVVLHTHG